MASLVNGHVNGHMPSLDGPAPTPISKRFTEIPSAVDIPVAGADIEEAVELNLEELLDDPTELCTLLDNEHASKNLWMTISQAYAKQNLVDHAIEIVGRGLHSLSRALPKEKNGLMGLQAWLYLLRSRDAPRMGLGGAELDVEENTKEFYLQAATSVLNEALRQSQSQSQVSQFPPHLLASGVLSIIRLSMMPISKGLGAAVDQEERRRLVSRAFQNFDQALKQSGGRNMMALLGKARVLFLTAKYQEALETYQEVLSRMPDLHDPDPRIGIGCCLWQLSYFAEAKEAWERALELNSESKIANILLAIAYLRESNNLDPQGPHFAPLYRLAMNAYAQKAFMMDQSHPFSCEAVANYFMQRQEWGNVDSLARKAVELTDVPAVASDGWYLLAKKEHYQENPNWARTIDFYSRSDNARGGEEKGYVPAKFGAAQAQVRNKDFDGAKFRLEKLIKSSNCIEAKALLGMIYARQALDAQSAAPKEEKASDAEKAISLLEAVRSSWKDPKVSTEPDVDFLFTLSQLYEGDQPEKSYQCLVQAADMISKSLEEERQRLDTPNGSDDEMTITTVPPQVTNNMACLRFRTERYDMALAGFESALKAAGELHERVRSATSDQLVTTISYNLARAHEAFGDLAEAKRIYESLLARHSDYSEAKIRLAYIELRENPSGDHQANMNVLMETEDQNMEARVLFGWYLNKFRRRGVADEREQRHYKHTLQQFDKHDQYSLTGMGNIYLTMAREMKRDTEQDREKRRKTYERAVEFYHKALQLDPKNAYAAQGVGIALAEDKKDFSSAVQIFAKVKDAIKESSVLVNLGHVYTELKQYNRAIENYESAVEKDRARDHQLLACLGRVYFLKAKTEQDRLRFDLMKTSLSYSRKAYDLAPDHIHYKFNVAFVQIQIAQYIQSLETRMRKLDDVEEAAKDLDEAIEAFTSIAKAKNPPYPRHDIEQRAVMGRNSMRKQLDRQIQSQREYEADIQERIAKSQAERDAKREKEAEEQRKADAEEAERKQKLREDRARQEEEAKIIAAKRNEEERRREDAEYTENTDGERVKRKSRAAARASAKRKKAGDRRGSESEGGESGINSSGHESSGSQQREHRDQATTEPRRKARTKNLSSRNAVTSGEEGGAAPRKKRKLARKSDSGKSSKYKSAEMVVDSDEDDVLNNNHVGDNFTNNNNNVDEDDEDEGVAISGNKGRHDSETRKNRETDEDGDDEDEDMGGIATRALAMMHTSGAEDVDMEGGGAPQLRQRSAARSVSDEDTAMKNANGASASGDDNDDDEDMVVRAKARHKPARRIEDDDDDNDSEA